MPSRKLKIHFIGAGGIGVSALAKHYSGKGFKVTGSDLSQSEITEELAEKGVKIYFGKNKKSNLPKDADLVVYSPAVKENNPELIQAKKLKIKTLSYPEALAKITEKYFTIAVSGTHGKSTTVSMLSLILEKSGLEPTVIAGTKIKNFKEGNYRKGSGKYLIIEACEYKESFLRYFPNVAVITNIEADHLDYFKNIKNVLNAFKKFIEKIPEKGAVIVNGDDKNIAKIIKGNAKAEIIKFSLGQKKDAEKLKRILKVPGTHNTYNALSALTAARYLKIPDRKSFCALGKYKPSWRRLEERKSKTFGKKTTIISDYGHHPTEVKATIQAIREKYERKRIWCVFQPHQHQRTRYFFDDFVKNFRKANLEKIIITDIYDVAGREKEKEKADPKKMARKINRECAIYVPKEKIISFLKKNSGNFDILIMMGAGDIYEIDKKI